MQIGPASASLTVSVSSGARSQQKRRRPLDAAASIRVGQRSTTRRLSPFNTSMRPVEVRPYPCDVDLVKRLVHVRAEQERDKPSCDPA